MNSSNTRAYPLACFPLHFTRSIYFFRATRSIYNLPRRTFCACPVRDSRINACNALDAFARSNRISYDVMQRPTRSTFAQWHDKSASNVRFILSVNLLDTATRHTPNFKSRIQQAQKSVQRL